MSKIRETGAVLLAVLLLCGGCAAEKDLPKLTEVGFYYALAVHLLVGGKLNCGFKP